LTFTKFNFSFSWFRSAKNETCVGVDASRNFDYKWKKDDHDSGGNRCSDFFEGSSARSESEVKLLSNFLLKNNKTIKLFLNLDGFGSQISFPSTSLKASSIEILNDVAKAGLKNVRSYRDRENRFFVKKDTTLTTPEAFAMHKVRIKFSFKIESAENRQASIFVPATDIERNAKDILNIILGMVKKIQDYW
jgi:Zinc carboxypeptidase